MNKNEKILLLQKVMEDIRGDWGSNLSDRIEDAINLAEELDFPKTIKLLCEYKEYVEDGDNDGRFLRCHYEDGGYIGLTSLHGLPNTIIDKSDKFKSSLDMLNNPECHFDDWDNWPTKDKQKYVMY